MNGRRRRRRRRNTKKAILFSLFKNSLAFTILFIATLK